MQRSSSFPDVIKSPWIEYGSLWSQSDPYKCLLASCLDEGMFEYQLFNISWEAVN